MHIFVYYVGCTDVICNIIAQMLLSIVYGTGVIMPISYDMLLHRCYCALFVAKMLMSHFYPPRIWKRYVDDTFVLQHQAHQEEFLQHISTVDPSIQFTVEEAKEDGSIPFLETVIRPEAYRTFTIGVYRKTHPH